MAPLFKNGTKQAINNYRPISILPVLSKLLEKHVHGSLMEFLNCFHLFHTIQSGFRPNHSRETELVGKWLKAINENRLVGVVMVDFKKAFDIVDTNALLNKFKHYNILVTTLKWFSSCLLGRKQKVSNNNILSTNEAVINCVPQESILGPLLFLFFINDLPLYSDEVTNDLYADDPTLYYTRKSINLRDKKLSCKSL